MGSLNMWRNFLSIEMLLFVDEVEVRFRLKLCCWDGEWVRVGAVQRAYGSGPAKVGRYVIPKRRQLMAQLRDGRRYHRVQQCGLGLSVILVF